MRLVVLLTVLCAAGLGAPQNRTSLEDVIIKRPVHLEGLPLERNGELNKNYREELLLNSINSMDDETEDMNDPKKLSEAIEAMFKKSDKNGDNFLTVEELEETIDANMRHHLETSRLIAEHRFKLADTNIDHLLTWDEYLPHFLKSEKGDEHKDEHGNHIKTKDDTLKIENEKSSFDLADDNKDGFLDSQEFLTFLHPEHSMTGLTDMAEEIMKGYDSDKDGIVSRDEFIAPLPGKLETGDVMFERMESDEKKKREHEFDRDIDLDKDGRATLAELIDYVNPQNGRQARREVQDILQIVDADGDGRLSLKELMDRDWLLADSGLISPAKRLHDDL